MRYVGDLVDVACGCRVGRQFGDLVDVTSFGVVCLSFDIGKVWRIVPCVYTMYTLGRFQFHNLLRRNLVVRATGGL